ncbi:MAG: o-succinylbenzoate--CoA ligase [Bacillota bacterium]
MNIIMNDSVGKWLDRRVYYDSDKLALVYGDQRFTYKQFNQRVNKFGNALKALGVRKGDRVAALMLNCNQFLEINFAAAKLGAIFVPINFRLTAPEVEYILKDASASVFVYHQPFADLVDSIQDKVPCRSLICIEGPRGGHMGYEQVLDGQQEPLPVEDVMLDDVQMMMYTSGTTGKPKGAMLTHGNIFYQTLQGIAMVQTNSDDIALIVAPLFHIGGFGQILAPLYLGGTVILRDKYDPVDALKTIAEEKVTVFFLVPTMWLALTKMPDFDDYDLSSLRICLSGGESCPLTVIEFFQSKGVNFLEGFGMTETTAGGTVLRSKEARRKNGSVGLPLPLMSFRIVDDDDKDVPNGEVGELVLKGPNICKGYWNNPEATGEAFRNGWFHTGDLVRQDEDGFLYIVDRKKDMIISGGENIYPVEIEQILYRHPKIHEVAVVGLRDEKWGERPVAVVAVKPGESISESEVIDFCEDKLARFKIPKQVQFVDHLPRNATGKVLKTQLRAVFNQPC